MDSKKDFKPVLIHNGCRQPKINIVNAVAPESKFKAAVRQWLKKIVFNIHLVIVDIAGANTLLINEETENRLLVGNGYEKLFESRLKQLEIQVNHFRIQFHYAMFNLFVNLAKIFKVYE